MTTSSLSSLSQHTYYLDVQTLLERLEQHSALFTTELPEGIAGLLEPCRGYLHVQQGRVSACLIASQSGLRLEGELAFEQLRTVETWHVTLLTSDARSLARELPAPVSRVFRQCEPRHPDALVFLSSRERVVARMVLFMLNGTRTIEQVQTLLHLPALTVEQMVDRLEQMQLIERVEVERSEQS